MTELPFYLIFKANLQIKYHIKDWTKLTETKVWNWYWIYQTICKWLLWFITAWLIIYVTDHTIATTQNNITDSLSDFQPMTCQFITGLRCRDKQTLTPTFTTMGNLEWPITLTCTSLECGRKRKGWTHTGTGTTEGYLSWVPNPEPSC